MTPQRILVTGSSGRLGREIVRLLRRSGYDVLGIDLSPADTTGALVDIRAAAAVREAVRGAAAVIHTAALHGRHYELGYPREEFLHANVLGAFHLLDACVRHGVPKFVYTSTTSIYGHAMTPRGRAVWVTEELPPDPRDIYDITKLSAELLCRDYFEKEGIETTVLRVSRFMPEPDEVRAVHRLCRGLDEADGAHAHLLALRHRFERFEIFNISNQSPFREHDLAELYSDPARVIARYYPEAPEVFRRKGWRFPASIDRVYVIDKAVRMLGYRPTRNFDSFLDGET